MGSSRADQMMQLKFHCEVLIYQGGQARRASSGGSGSESVGPRVGAAVVCVTQGSHALDQ